MKDKNHNKEVEKWLVRMSGMQRIAMEQRFANHLVHFQGMSQKVMQNVKLQKRMASIRQMSK